MSYLHFLGITMKLQIRTCFAFAIFLLTAASMVSGQSLSAEPEAAKRPVTDEYQGVKVTDDYRWLENWDDAEVKRWTAAENVATRDYLDHVQVRDAVKERLQQLFSAQSTTYSGLRFRGGMLFAIRYQPPAQQPVLVAMSSPNDPASAKVVFDANVGSGQSSLAIDYYTPSLDGKYVAVALSKGGSEDSSAHIFEVATGKERERSVYPQRRRRNLALRGKLLGGDDSFGRSER